MLHPSLGWSFQSSVFAWLHPSCVQKIAECREQELELQFLRGLHNMDAESRDDLELEQQFLQGLLQAEVHPVLGEVHTPPRGPWLWWSTVPYSPLPSWPLLRVSGTGTSLQAPTNGPSMSEQCLWCGVFGHRFLRLCVVCLDPSVWGETGQNGRPPNEWAGGSAGSSYQEMGALCACLPHSHSTAGGIQQQQQRHAHRPGLVGPVSRGVR